MCFASVSDIPKDTFALQTLLTASANNLLYNFTNDETNIYFESDLQILS